jgi:hypothetical protein
MAKGVHNAPQTAYLYCAHYELHYVVRRFIHYLSTLKLYESVPTTPKNEILRAEMASLFNMCTSVDDIAVVGMPVNIDVASMLKDERATGGSDGVYPTYMTDNDGNVIINPTEVNQEKHGLSCSYLDMSIKYKARGYIQSAEYNKRDDMQVFRNR